MQNFAAVYFIFVLCTSPYFTMVVVSAQEDSNDIVALESLHDTAKQDESHDIKTPEPSRDTAAPQASFDTAPEDSRDTDAPEASHEYAAQEPGPESSGYRTACTQRTLKLFRMLLWFVVALLIAGIVLRLCELFPIGRRHFTILVKGWQVIFILIIIPKLILLWYIVFLLFYYLPFPWWVLCPCYFAFVPLKDNTDMVLRVLFHLFVLHTYFDIPLVYILFVGAYVFVSGFLTGYMLGVASIRNQTRRNYEYPPN